MQLRLTGTRAECDAMVTALRAVTTVVAARPRRPRDDSGDLVMVDVETRGDASIPGSVTISE